MPRTRLIKSIIDALATPDKEIVYWDESLPGFGLKITPKGRKVFIVLYRAGGSGSRLRKYTIGPYGRVTLHNARLEAQKVLAARLAGRDPATEKRQARRRITVDTVAEIVALYAKQHLSKRRSGRVMTQILQRELVERWGSRSVHEVSKRDIIDLITAVVDRGAPMSANHTLKVTRAFFNWCVGRAILERSPCDGIKAPTIAKTRDRVLTDKELAGVLLAARARGGSYGAIVEVLALTGQRREEVVRMSWAEIDFVGRHWTLPGTRTKNSKTHIVQLSDLAVAVILAQPRFSTFVFPAGGGRPFSHFSREKRRLDALSGVLGWRLHDHNSFRHGSPWRGAACRRQDPQPCLRDNLGRCCGLSATRVHGGTAGRSRTLERPYRQDPQSSCRATIEGGFMSPGRWVTTEKAKEILERLHPWLDTHPPLEEFTERLDATVETVWPLPHIAGLYVALDRAIARLRGPVSEASSCPAA